MVVGTIYGFFTHWNEPVGAVVFYLTGLASMLIGGFLWWTGRRLDPRPDDNPHGEQDEVEGDYGFFSPHSWWPLFLAASLAVLTLGLAIGWWLVLLALPFVAISTLGWVFEYFRGDQSI